MPEIGLPMLLKDCILAEMGLDRFDARVRYRPGERGSTSTL